MGNAAAHTFTSDHPTPLLTNSPKWVPGSQIIRELETLTGQGCPITFRRLIDLAASNRVPLSMQNGRWGVERHRLSEVAEALGMVVRANAREADNARSFSPAPAL